MAAQLRAAWRVQRAAPGDASQAPRLLDRALLRQQAPELYLLRAASASQLGDAAATTESARKFLQHVESRAASSARQGQSLPQAERTRLRTGVEGLHRHLESVAATGSQDVEAAQAMVVRAEAALSSLRSQKARIGLSEKALPHKSHHIMICDIGLPCQNLTPEYWRINPKGTVPTLVHKGEPVYDAHRIVKHVDEQYPSSGLKLWPDDPQKQEAAQYWFEFGMLDEKRVMGSSFGTAIPILTLPILAQTISQQPLETVEANMSRHPLPERGQMFIGLRKHGSQLPPELLDQAIDSLCQAPDQSDA